MKGSNITITQTMIALWMNPFRGVRGRALGHRILQSLTLLLVIFAMPGSACRKQPAAVEIKGPILEMESATGFDEKGQAKNPAFAFAPTEPQLVVILQVGRLEPGTAQVRSSDVPWIQLQTIASAATESVLDVAWYRTSDEGEQKLFEHRVSVQSYDRAYSIGKSKGTLKAGSYMVRATLAGQTQETELEVRPAKTDSSSEPSSDVSVTKGSTAGNGNDAGPGEPPVAGGSGTMARPSGASAADSSSGPGPGQCEITIPGTHAERADTVKFVVVQRCPPGATYGRVDTWVNIPDGPAEHLGVLDGPPLFGVRLGAFRVNPCSVFGSGGDLPGTKLVVSATGPEIYSTENVITLGPDQDAPRISVNSSPPKGTRVKPGDVIRIDATASERRSGGTWQTGVQVFQLVGPEGKITDVTDPSRLPKPCESKSWSKVLDASYRVPDNSPPVIKLCAIAEDYAGNESFKCGEFPTVDVWEGTLGTLVTVDGPFARCTGTWQARIKILVREDGTAIGEISVIDAPVNSCGGSTYAILGSKWPITGVVNDAGFTFPLSQFVGEMVQGSASILKSGRNDASGTATPEYSPSAGLTNSFVMKFELKCKTCRME